MHEATNRLVWAMNLRAPSLNEPYIRNVFRKFFRVPGRLHPWWSVARVKRIATALLGVEYQRALRRIEIDITYACNLRCFNCDRSCEQAPTGEHLTARQIAQFVKESVENGVQWERIRLLGGEPTLHKEFFEILELLRDYRRQHAPAMIIEVTTNGFGPRVNEVIARIPDDVVLDNTKKSDTEQPAFNTINVAPVDLREYRSSDYRNGCIITQRCGIGLTPYGYYPCAVAGGMDRIFGWNVGRQRLPQDGDSMHDLLEKFCSHCGHFKRRPETPVTHPVMSATWRDAYAAYRRSKPKLTNYGS